MKDLLQVLKDISITNWKPNLKLTINIATNRDSSINRTVIEFSYKGTWLNLNYLLLKWEDAMEPVGDGQRYRGD